MIIADLNPGEIADNFLRVLHNSEKKVIRQLERNNYLKVFDTFPQLTYRSICFKGLEAYAKETRTPLCYFFFGSHQPPVPQYTVNDGYVIDKLNRLSMSELVALKKTLGEFFPNPLFDLDEPDYRRRTILLLLNRIPREKVPDTVEVEPYKDIDPELIHEYLELYKKKNYGWVKLDTANEIATYLGVSLFWILNVKTAALFCSNYLADQVFSFYTLLPDYQKQQFISLLEPTVEISIEQKPCEIEPEAPPVAPAAAPGCISFTYGEDTLTMSPLEIDIDVLAEHRRDTVKGWIKEAREAWDQAIRDRFTACLARRHRNIVKAHQKTYCPDSMAKIARNCASKTKRTKYPLCGLIYVSTRYQISCHQLLFGLERPVELFGRTKAFLMTLPEVDFVTRERVLQCLRNGYLDTDSPMYILKERCLEAGYAQGMSYYSICAMVIGSPAQQKIIDHIFGNEISHKVKSLPEDVAAHSPGYNMILRDCRKYKVSADYLVLQDYSDHAVLDGEPLTPIYKEWLSTYLCASPQAQTTAIAILTHYQMQRAKDMD